MQLKAVPFQDPLSQCKQSFQKSLPSWCILWCPVLTCHQLRLWVPFLLLLPTPLRLIAAASAVRHQDSRPPSGKTPLTFFPFPLRFVLSWCSQNLLLRGTPAVAPHMRYKHLLLDLTPFAQFNKKGFHTRLNRYVQHDRPVPQMKLVPFNVAEIIVRTASLAYLQEDGSKDKRKYEVSGGKHTL